MGVLGEIIDCFCIFFGTNTLILYLGNIDKSRVDVFRIIICTKRMKLCLQQMGD